MIMRLIALGALFFCLLGCASNSKKLESSIMDFWQAYQKANQEELMEMIEPKYYAYFLNAVRPDSKIVKLLKVKKVETFHENLGRIIFSIGEFEPWIVVRRDNREKPWKFTFDEREVLARFTAGWKSYKYGNITIHLFNEPDKNDVVKINELLKKHSELKKIFGFEPAELDYYSSPLEIAPNIIGEKYKGAGNARYRMIKAVDRLDHTHELVHVFALEIGYVGPLIDEGIATAFGSVDLLSTKEQCYEVKELLKKGLSHYFDGGNFLDEHLNRKNVYGLSQILVQYWCKKFGIEKIKLLLNEGLKKPHSLEKISADLFEPIKITEANLSTELALRCRMLE